MSTQTVKYWIDGTPQRRESKEWWSVTEYGVQKVTGFSCGRNNPKLWWCPAVGYTLTENYSLFETEKEAIRKCIADLEAQAAVIEQKLTPLRKRNAELKETNPLTGLQHSV
jgi:hypothetical protein